MGSQIKELGGHTDVVHSLCFSPDSSVLASGMLYGETMGPWLAQSNQRTRGHTDIVHSLCFSPDSSMLASGIS